jgi:predicted RNA-binding Zn-ribbon protein involved in translation (DUF1610 family)
MTSEGTTVDVARMLGEIPELFALLPLYGLPGSTPPDPDARRGTSSPAKPPTVLDVVDLLDTREKPQADDGERDVELDKRAGYRRLGILPTLGLWVSMVAAELDDMDEPVEVCCPDRQHTVAGECAWLTTHLDRILELHPDFPEDVEWMWRDLRRVVGERDPLTFYCPKCGWRIEPQDDATWFRCTGCPQTWRMDAEIRRLGATQELTLKQIASMRGLALKTLHDWSARGWIAPIGRSARGFLYDIARVDDLLESGRVRQKRA